MNPTPAKWEDLFDERFKPIDFSHFGENKLPYIEQTRDEIKSFIHQLLSDYKSRLLSEVEKADIAEDKVGTFQDGYRCFKAQVIALIRKEN